MASAQAGQEVVCLLAVALHLVTCCFWHERESCWAVESTVEVYEAKP